MDVIEILESYIPRRIKVNGLKREYRHLEELDVKRHFLIDSEKIDSEAESKRRLTVADQYDILMKNKEKLKVEISLELLENMKIENALEILKSKSVHLGRTLEFKYLEGMSVNVISEMMFVAPRTVERRIDQATNGLESILINKNVG